MFMKSFFGRIADDFKQKELFPLKTLFFVHASTLLVLYPYLTIHMRELGISVEETAIMSGVTPVVAIVMPPLAGVVADRIGNFKVMLALFSSLGGLAALLLLAVPVGRYNVHYPDHVSLSLGCSGSSMELGWADPNPCTVTQLSPAALNLTLESCGVQCVADLADRVTLNRTINQADRYTVRMADLDARGADSFTYSMHGLGDGTQRQHRLPRLVPAAGNASAYFPTPGLHSLNCEQAEAGGTLNCSMGRDEALGDGSPLDQPTKQRTFRASLSVRAGGPAEARRFLVTALAGQGNASLLLDRQPVPAICRDATARDGRQTTVRLSEPGPRSPASALSRCVSTCLVSAPRAQLCSNAMDVVEVDPKFTFWMYLVVRVFVGMIGGTTFAMFEGAVIAILREHNADYGLQRIYAAIGGMISSPLSGLLMDWASAGKGYTDFRPAFYLYAALKLASGFLMLTINLEFKTPAQHVVTDVLQVLKNVEMVCLFLACFVLGTAWGYIESFLFWLLQDLGGSRSLMGITVTVGGVAGLPLLVLSGPIIQKIGHANVLFIGFIFYAIRLFGYSMIYNPWYCLIFEAMESFTSSLATTAAVTYAATLSTTSTDTSIQGLIGGLYYGVGKGSGSLIGGYLMTAVGTRNTYRIFAAATCGAGIMYFLFNRFYIRNHRAKNPDKFGEKPPASDKDKEACQMTEVTKDIKELTKEDKSNSSVLNNKPVVDAMVQQKNGKNSQPAEKAPLKVNALRDYSSAADTPSSRRCSVNSLSVPEQRGDVRRRKSSDCSQVAVNLGYVQDKAESEKEESPRVE